MNRTQKLNSKKSWLAKKKWERGQRALERQLEYQEKKARNLKGSEQGMAIGIIQRAQQIRRMLEEIQPIPNNAAILEVGCGAHGLIFGIANHLCVGIDPLAVEYKRLFPMWHGNAQTVSAAGENLPFEDALFDIVLSDNVIDHAEEPDKIIDELARVLKPKGILYFTVNVHHPIYQIVSNLHGIWNALGFKYEISPFADHTIHYTEDRVKRVFSDLPFEIIQENSPVNQRKDNPQTKVRGLEGRFKKRFFKNALFELIAQRKENH